MSIKTFPLKGFSKKLFFKIENYSNNGSEAVSLFSMEDGYEEDFAGVSVNLDKLPQKGFWVKNYGENSDLIDALVDNGFLEKTGEEAQAGYVTVPSMILTEKALKYVSK